uniref:Caspr5 protein isoform 1-like n=1 Tax=Ciona intestinalis TaxID=7719 RepID=Q69HM0_CIOIN|nr:caspr5 protein isoform 1-like precursor [Ciona intestinalis]AAP91761.1 caspr5 protein isoform 1-like [Ciona intestinalis]|eukprot:NP_001231944.1 caspr5 protein isoform 1-like precursor [Ciona intestinalis]
MKVWIILLILHPWLSETCSITTQTDSVAVAYYETDTSFKIEYSPIWFVKPYKIQATFVTSWNTNIPCTIQDILNGEFTVSVVDSGTHTEYRNAKIRWTAYFANEIPRSCADMDSKISALYLIDPLPENRDSFPFYAKCDFTFKPIVTIIDPNSTYEEEALKDCEGPGCYKYDVQYVPTALQLQALSNQSQHCRQYISVRCQGSQFTSADGKVFAWWLSGSGEKKYYWGDATSMRKGYCACGETNTCAKEERTCNCDNNRITDHIDEGWITEKSDLPITALQFGDLQEDNERLWHTMGPLECFGTSPSV